jgi:DNA-directed RNA polymerase specialized sigma24 family protein
MLDERLRMLPPKLEAAVRICCLKNPPVSPEDAAEILGVSVATLYRMLGKAKTALGSEPEFNYHISLPKGVVS